ncbi:hypothetical protein [Amycolatopsis sp. lyj-109]|uniref:hypothetical protein n=1 Tax=Amycolatopsis sp. lyj-109 TaxID=2789287 RepID=UPI00397D5615
MTGGNAGYREQSTTGKREPRGMLRYSDIEWAVIVQVAALAGMKPAAWAQQAAYEAALQAHLGKGTDRGAVTALIQELREHRRVVTNVGGNLNDVAKVANSTGEIENANAAATVLRLVANVVRTADTMMKDIRQRLLP